MLATVEWVAKRYGVLPSYLLREGDSIDMLIADLGARYETFMHKKAEAKQKGLPPPTPDYSQDELKKMVDNVKATGKQ